MPTKQTQAQPKIHPIEKIPGKKLQTDTNKQHKVPQLIPPEEPSRLPRVNPEVSPWVNPEGYPETKDTASDQNIQN